MRDTPICVAAILDGAAHELRAAIAKLPPGEACAEGMLDSDGVTVDRPIRLAVTVTAGDGIVNFDFSDSDPQARGPVNLRPSMVEACVFYSLIGCLGPRLAFNDGMRDVVRLVFAPRTIVNAQAPAPVSNYQMVNLKLVDVILEALATFDFSASDPQARGPVNLRPSMVEACVFYSLIGCLGPRLDFNDGMRDVVRLVLAPRTIVNAQAPAPVSNYQMGNLKLVDVILEALATFHPARATAHAGSSSALSIAYAKPRPGQSTMQYEIMGSAYGGGTGHDGASATATHLSNLHITPIEILESEYPCRVARFDLVPDSGGAGQWRGGLALRREYELLEDATVIRRFDKTRFPPQGVSGGKPGGRARFVVRLGTADEHETRASARYEMKAGERFLLQSAAGGGFGDPAKRDRAAITRDLAEGFLTEQAAREVYRDGE